jgi:hypothetical protein
MQEKQEEFNVVIGRCCCHEPQPAYVAHTQHGMFFLFENVSTVRSSSSLHN